MKAERISYIDTAKGIAVLLVIIGHVYSVYYNNWLLNIVSSLHNPTFYLASGMLMALNSKKLERPVLKNIKEYGLKLLVPFGIWSGVYATVFHLISGKDIITCLLDSVNKLWFFPILFLGSCLIILADKLSLPSIIVLVICSIGIIFFSFYSSMITKVIAYPQIVFIGYTIKDAIIKEKYKTAGFLSAIEWIVYCFLCIAGIVTVDAMVTTGAGLCLSMLSSLCGGIVIISISKILSEKYRKNPKALLFIGQNSLYFYLFHFIGIYYLQLNDHNPITAIIGVVLCFTCPILFILALKNKKIDFFLCNIKVKQ